MKCFVIIGVYNIPNLLFYGVISQLSIQKSEQNILKSPIFHLPVQFFVIIQNLVHLFDKRLSEQGYCRKNGKDGLLVRTSLSFHYSFQEICYGPHEWLSCRNLSDSGRLLQDDASSARNLPAYSYKINMFQPD